MDKQKAWLIGILVILFLAMSVDIWYQNNKINSQAVQLELKNKVAEVEKKTPQVVANEKEIEGLRLEKEVRAKKITDLENQLLALRKKKPSKEGIANEVKSFSINDVSDALGKLGFSNTVILRSGNICQSQYSSKASR